MAWHGLSSKVLLGFLVPLLNSFPNFWSFFGTFSLVATWALILALDPLSTHFSVFFYLFYICAFFCFVSKGTSCFSLNWLARYLFDVIV